VAVGTNPRCREEHRKGRRHQRLEGEAQLLQDAVSALCPVGDDAVPTASQVYDLLQEAHGVAHRCPQTMRRWLIKRGHEVAASHTEWFHHSCAACQRVNHRSHHHMRSTHLPIPDNATGGWSLDYLALPDGLQVLILSSRVSRHLLLDLISVRADAGVIWNSIERKLLDDPIFNGGGGGDDGVDLQVQWVYSDKDARHTTWLEDQFKRRGVEFFTSIPNSHGNGAAEKACDIVRKAVTRRRCELGGWANLRPGIGDFLQQLEQSHHDTPRRVLRWDTPDEFIARPAEYISSYISDMKAAAAARVEEANEGKQVPLPTEGLFMYWPPSAEAKHPDAHIYSGPFWGASCPNHGANCRRLWVGDDKWQHAAVWRLKRYHYTPALVPHGIAPEEWRGVHVLTDGPGAAATPPDVCVPCHTTRNVHNTTLAHPTSAGVMPPQSSGCETAGSGARVLR